MGKSTLTAEQLARVKQQPSDTDVPFRKGEVQVTHDRSMRGAKSETDPFNFSTVDGTVSFDFWINPSECGWRIPLRTTIEMVQGGAVHHEWDQTGFLQPQTKLDLPVLNFTFQSGNLAPRSWLDQSTATGVFAHGGNVQFGQSLSDAQNIAQNGLGSESQPTVPKGLCNFYDFIALLDQPNLTADGRPNYVVIKYHSLMFPLMELKGFFTQEGVQWTDNAENPNGITSWGASFMVFESSPSLFDRQALRDCYRVIFG